MSDFTYYRGPSRSVLEYQHGVFHKLYSTDHSAYSLALSFLERQEKLRESETCEFEESLSLNFKDILS